MSQENVEAVRRAYAAFSEGNLGPVLPEQLIDAGEDVLAVAQVGGPGRRSGADVMARVGHVLTFRDGRIVRFIEFKDIGDAFKAVGRSEQDAHADSR